MSDLPAQIQVAIRERNLFRRGERILVAVSGGLDSMVLLHQLAELADGRRWKLHVAHFNHQLRGRASTADERFVAQAARKLGLPFTSGRGAVRSAARKRGESLEMAARELRHRFLAGAARQLNCRCVALAHHAGDQVELFFLRLFRGAGGEGLGGMKWVSPSPADRRVRLVRPFLATEHDALCEYARRQRIRFRKDASNDSTEILRNRIRHELLPWLRRNYQPALDKIIGRVMEIVAGEAEVVSEAARTVRRMKPRTLAGWPVGLQRRILQSQLLERGIAPNYELIESLRQQPDQPVSLGPRRTVVRDRMGRIRVTARRRGRFDVRQAAVALDCKAGSVSFGGVELQWWIEAGTGRRIPRAGSGREFFDADRVGSRLILRHWQAGDRFRPIGLNGSLKLQDWFTNQKIPSAERRRVVVAVGASGEIFWVEGQRIGEACKLRSDTRRRLIWRWKRG